MLLLLGLLAGLFGMHGLGPGGTVASHSAAGHGHARAMSGHPTAMTADATCASGAVGAGPALPALVPDPAGTGVTGDHDRRSPVAVPDGDRAPPSLAELQILRT